MFYTITQDKATSFRIVVASLQKVMLGFGIEVLPTTSKRIENAYDCFAIVSNVIDYLLLLHTLYLYSTTILMIVSILAY